MVTCHSCLNQYDERYMICPICGQSYADVPKEPVHLTPGTVLSDRYAIGTAVGSGGFGIVYMAWDRKLENVVAIKEFFVNRLVTRVPGQKEISVLTKNQKEFEYRKQRFLAEARTMAKFRNHRSIPNVFEFFEENKTAYIVMELLQGLTLGEYIRSNSDDIDKDFALMVITEVAGALSSLHKEGITHCDVAPDNIFLCEGKEIRVKLMDLGAAQLDEGTAGVMDIILKPGFSPPEQYDDSKNIGPWTDIYSLGATLYMMLTGIKPDESTNRKISDIVVPPMRMNAAVGENLSNAIMKALALDIHMRFRKVEELLEAINGKRKVRTLAREKKLRRLRRFLSISTAVVVVAVAAGFALMKFSEKLRAERLEPAEISVWYSVKNGSDEETAMQYIIEDFERAFPKVSVTLRAIPEEIYVDELAAAAESNSLPDLFESTDIPEELLENAIDLRKLLDSEQAEDCLFLEQYDSYYDGYRKLPLAIEVPVAYVVTAGETAVRYESDYFSAVSDFDTQISDIALDGECKEMVIKNFGENQYTDSESFWNKASPVLLSSTLALNEFRNTLVGFEKRCVYPDNEKVYCGFTYEWSVGASDKAEKAASERLLCWMLGNSYQSALMISKCSDGQIPLNEASFMSKVESGYFSPIDQIKNQLVFEE